MAVRTFLDNNDKEELQEQIDEIKENDNANALVGNAQGDASVYIDDISPIEHTLDVKVRSKNILDTENATVWTRAPGAYNDYITAEKHGNGIKLTANKESAQSWETGGFTLGLTKDFLGKTLTLSFGNVSFSMQSGNHKTAILFGICKYNNYYMGDLANLKSVSTVAVATNVLTVTIPADADYETYPYLRIGFYINNGGVLSVGDYAIYENIMVEESASVSEYVPYANVGDYHVDVSSTEMDDVLSYPINDDGSVDGVTSIYPTMTIESIVVDGMVIEATYNKDANKVVATLEERIAALEAAIIA